MLDQDRFHSSISPVQQCSFSGQAGFFRYQTNLLQQLPHPRRFTWTFSSDRRFLYISQAYRGLYATFVITTLTAVFDPRYSTFIERLSLTNFTRSFAVLSDQRPRVLRFFFRQQFFSCTCRRNVYFLLFDGKFRRRSLIFRTRLDFIFLGC